jgi:hypothetical protein
MASVGENNGESTRIGRRMKVGVEFSAESKVKKDDSGSKTSKKNADNNVR